MIRFLFIVLVLIASVFLGLKIAQDPGYVIFAYQNWTVEMPLWFMVIATIVTLLILYFILRFFDGIETTWFNFKNWLRMRKKYKSYSKTNRGLIALIEAQWKLAENNAMSGVDQSDAPLINFLVAAKAANEQGAYERRDTYLRRAYDVAPQSSTAIGLVQAQFQINQNKYEQALATLNHLNAEAPKQPLVLQLLEKVYLHLGEWKNLLNILPSLKKAKLITAEQYVKLENTAYQELIKLANKSNNLAALRQYWDLIPGSVKKSPDVVYAYAVQLLQHAGTSSEVEDLICKSMKRGSHDGLILLYGKLQTENALKQLKIAESWEKNYPNNPYLLLTLGRLSVNCQIWGKARQHFEDSLKIKPMSETYLELGNLLYQLKEVDAAVRVYKAGLK